MYQSLEDAKLKLNGSVGSKVSAQPTLDKRERERALERREEERKKLS